MIRSEKERKRFGLNGSTGLKNTQVFGLIIVGK